MLLFVDESPVGLLDVQHSQTVTADISPASPCLSSLLTAARWTFTLPLIKHLLPVISKIVKYLISDNNDINDDKKIKILQYTVAVLLHSAVHTTWSDGGIG